VSGQLHRPGRFTFVITGLNTQWIGGRGDPTAAMDSLEKDRDYPVTI